MKWIVLLCINIFLYISAGAGGTLVVFFSVLLTYIAGLALSKITKYRKSICFAYILLQIIVLFSFKYRLIFNMLTPIAISYYTLTSIGYVIDVYRGKYNAQKNFFKLMCVISFFPLMLQGPICRYDDLEKDIFGIGNINYENFTYGLTRIAYGAMKKLIIADRLAIVFDGLLGINDSGTMIAFNVVVYAFYLYTDFSGGIDIAIGVGKLLGVKLPENFNSPFLAVSITDYWRRWHMSLGAWLKDYVFYPVSFSKPVVKLAKSLRSRWGNKISRKLPIYVATIIVWFITAVWHGVSGNFILWGMLNAIVLLASYELEPMYLRFNSRFEFTKGRLYRVFRVVRTFLLMGVLRMLDYTTVSGYFKSIWIMITDFSFYELFDGRILQLGIGFADYIVVVVGIFVMFIVTFIRIKSDYKSVIFEKGAFVSYGIIAVMVAITIIFGMYGIGYEGKDFIYIRY